MNNLPQETEALESRLSELETLTLPEKTEEAKVVISEAYRLARRSVTEAYYAGKILVSIKTELEHGEFGPWLERNGIKHDTAARLMKLAGREISDIQKFDSVNEALKAIKPPARKQEESSDKTPSTIEELTPSEKRLMEKDHLIQQVKETAEKLQESEVSLEEEKQKNKHLLQGKKIAEGFDQGVSVIEEAQVQVRQLKREVSQLKSANRELKKDFANYKRWATRELKKSGNSHLLA